MKTPLVSICCLTFNQSQYIRQCLDGFLMQETSFPFEILIHDDASSDGTVEIIKEYAEKFPDLIKPYFQLENQYSQGKGFIGLRINFERSLGRYIAVCEGDDYWTDPLKLQKQVDYLESHIDCSLCYHACRNVFSNGCNNIKPICDVVKDEYSFRDLVVGYPFQTATVMLRSDFLKTPTYKYIRNSGFSSIILFLSLCQYGTVRGINEQMSVYRRNGGGVTISDSSNLNLFLLKNLILLSTCLPYDKRKIIRNLQIVPQMIQLKTSSRKKYMELCRYLCKQSVTLAAAVCFSVEKSNLKQSVKYLFYGKEDRLS